MRRPNDFSDAMRRQLAERVAYMCSYRGCNLPTLAPAQGQPGALNLGHACHIVGASEKGPRPNSQYGLTDEQLRSPDNGIWMCVTHATVIDRDEHIHTVALLHQWKRDAEDRASRDANTGRQMRVNVSPHEVAPRALAFSQEVRAILPTLMRFMPNIRMDYLQRIETFLRKMHPFIPTNDYHGIDPELVAVQQQVLADLRAFVDFVKNSDQFSRDTDRAAYIPQDRSENGATVRYGDRLLQRIGEIIQQISERWGQGKGYYR